MKKKIEKLVTKQKRKTLLPPLFCLMDCPVINATTVLFISKNKEPKIDSKNVQARRKTLYCKKYLTPMRGIEPRFARRSAPKKEMKANRDSHYTTSEINK